MVALLFHSASPKHSQKWLRSRAFFVTSICATLPWLFSQAWAAGGGGSGLTIAPFASVSSTKSIKPNASKSASDEIVTQRITYGLGVELRLARFFSVGVKAGTNQVDTTKKASAMRDEYGDIDFEKDANVNIQDQNASYHYKEKQLIGDARAYFRPSLFSGLWAKFSAGVRARKRDVTVTQTGDTTTAKDIHDPIKYHAVGGAGLGFRLLKAFHGSIDYSFYFLKFPKTQPHEQSVSVAFGVEI